jgi:hypothetical protein
MEGPTAVMGLLVEPPSVALALLVQEPSRIATNTPPLSPEHHRRCIHHHHRLHVPSLSVASQGDRRYHPQQHPPLFAWPRSPSRFYRGRVVSLSRLHWVSSWVVIVAGMQWVARLGRQPGGRAQVFVLGIHERQERTGHMHHQTIAVAVKHDKSITRNGGETRLQRQSSNAHIINEEL